MLLAVLLVIWGLQPVILNWSSANARIVPQPKKTVWVTLVLWWKWVHDLPYAEAKPQEFELLSLAKAEDCLHFDFTPTAWKDLYENIKQFKVELKADSWCVNLIKIKAPSTDDGWEGLQESRVIQFI